jgi:hypothetical protein
MKFHYDHVLIIAFFFCWKICAAVQKERMEPEDMYVLSDNGSVLSAPSPKPYPHKPPKCTDCDSLFMKVNLVSHSINYCIVWVINSLICSLFFWKFTVLCYILKLWTERDNGLWILNSFYRMNYYNLQHRRDYIVVEVNW